MPHSKRKQLEVAERRAKVSELYARGLRQWEIARELGLAGAAGAMVVSRDLAAVQREWQQSAVRDYDTEKGRLLTEVAHLKGELWASWELSRKAKDGTPRPGDPRLAAQILDCIQEEAELLGIRPQRGEQSTAPPVVAFVVHQPAEANGQAGPPAPPALPPPPDAGQAPR